MIRLNIYKIKNKFREINFLKNIATHFLISAILLFLISLILGAFLFYRYVFLVKKIKPIVVEKNFLLKEDVYKEVINILNNREQIIKEIDFKQYSNPFSEKKIDLR